MNIEQLLLISWSNVNLCSGSLTIWMHANGSSATAVGTNESTITAATEIAENEVVPLSKNFVSVHILCRQSQQEEFLKDKLRRV